MIFTANDGKRVEIEAGGETYLRHAVRTHFVTQGEDYIAILRRYLGDIYQPGDIVSISEKIIALCQGRVVRREDIRIGLLAKLLSRFADRRNRGGYGVGMAINMQYAIDKAGALKVLFAAMAAGLGKVLGMKGVFYEIVGREVSGLDGFYGGVWPEYEDIGVEIPLDPSAVCDEIKAKLGYSCMIVDANDFGQVILGRSQDIALPERTLLELIRDNPAGQGRQLTPLILIRQKA